MDLPQPPQGTYTTKTLRSPNRHRKKRKNLPVPDRLAWEGRRCWFISVECILPHRILFSDTELRNIIDKLAQFVARNGPEFEQMTKSKQKGNPKFQFLYGGEFYNYYQYKVTTEQQGKLSAPRGRLIPRFWNGVIYKQCWGSRGWTAKAINHLRRGASTVIRQTAMLASNKSCSSKRRSRNRLYRANRI